MTESFFHHGHSQRFRRVCYLTRKMGGEVKQPLAMGHGKHHVQGETKEAKKCNAISLPLQVFVKKKNQLSTI